MGHWGLATHRRGEVHRSICTGPRGSPSQGPEGSQPERAQPGAVSQGSEQGHMPRPGTEHICHSRRQGDTGGSVYLQGPPQDLVGLTGSVS